MPRLPSLRIARLDALARELRYAPASRRREQLLRAMALTDELDPSRGYSEDWFIQRITGHRPDMETPSVFVGEALLSDLSAFVERVTDQAKLTAADLPGPSLSLQELRRRWNVSGRTIERYRRRGLIACRVRDDAGRTRLAFPVQSVQAFETAHRAQLDNASSTSRLTARERERIVRLAARAQRRFGWSASETAHRIAARMGRSHETIRQTLLRRDDGGRKRDRAAESRRAAALHRAALRGVPIRTLADRTGRSPATVRRLINEHRTEVARAATVGVAPLTDEAMKKIDTTLAPVSVREGLARQAALTVEAFMEEASSCPPPDRAQERELAEALRALRGRAARLVAEKAPGAAALDRAETDLRWSLALVAKLVRAQRGIALRAIEARLDGSLLQLPPASLRALHREAMEALIGAAWGFSPSRGGRLAAPAGLAVDRAAARWRSAPESGGRARAANVRLEDWTAHMAAWQRWVDPDPRLVRRLDELEETSRRVVELRYGLTGAAPMTMEELAAHLDIALVRIAPLQRAALERVRSRSS